MKQMTVHFFLVASSLIACMGAAHATFGDCGDEAYIDRFDERLSADDPFGCTEILRLPVTTSEGVRHIRVVHGFNADWALEPTFTNQVEQGVRASIAALGRIGPFRLDDVTILLADQLPRPPPGEGEIFDSEAAAGMLTDNECGIVYYLFNVLESPAATTAHEIFHCVEFATVGLERVLPTGGGTPGADWWLEGGAEWFGTFAVPEMPWLDDYAAEFDAKSVNLPIYSMDYEAVIFFLWLAAERGLEAVLPFMTQMAKSPSAAAQGAAMREVLPAESWRSFAEAYVDSDIKDPRGRRLGLTANFDVTWTFDESRNHHIQLDPFVVSRGILAFDCSLWEAAMSPNDANVRYQPFEGGEWGQLPERIDAERLEESEWAFAGVNVEADGLTIDIEGRVAASCAPCGGSEEIDACLVGVWKQTGGGALEWLNRQLGKKTDITASGAGSPVTRFGEDGIYITQPFGYGVSVVAPRSGAHGEGDGVGFSSGRWSATGDMLAMCPDAEGAAGSVTVTAPDFPTGTFPFNFAGGGSPTLVQYTCDASDLETRMPMMDDFIVTSYERIADE